MDTPVDSTGYSTPMDPLKKSEEGIALPVLELGDAPDVYPPLWKQALILFTLDLAIFIDVVSSAALFVVITQTAKDIGLNGAETSWIVTSYVITFAAFLLSAGRLADLWRAEWVFIIGIFGVSMMALIVSFLNTSIVFLVLRAVQGIFAAMTIPSSYNITVRTFPEGKSRNRAIAILGLVGSVSFSLGVIIGGVMESVSWRWLFRMISFMALTATGGAVLVVPRTKTGRGLRWRDILARMDPIGLLLSMAAIIFLVLALTSGPEHGWRDPRFSASLPISILCFVAFFVWEAKADETMAMLPAAVWKTPTVKPLVFLGLSPFIFWTTSAYGFPTYWQQILHIRAIDTAIRLLPIGIGAFSMSIIIQVKPRVLAMGRWTMFASMGIVGACTLLYCFSHGGQGSLYWRFAVPAFFIGSVCSQYACILINVFVITSVPPKRAGVAGGLMSVVCQLGNAVGLAIQAACLGEGGAESWEGYARGYWAVFGWIVGSVVLGGAVLALELRRRPVILAVDRATIQQALHA